MSNKSRRDTNIVKSTDEDDAHKLDTPSEKVTTGLPSTGEGASARQYLSDTAQKQGETPREDDKAPHKDEDDA